MNSESTSPSEGVSPERWLEEAGFLARIARELVGEAHGAEDLVQETWRVALEHPPRRSGPLRGWLATVAANLARNARRAGRTRKNREERVARPERLDDEPAALEKLELQRALLELVLALPEEQRTVLYLRYYAELAPDAIAARLGVPLKTVKSRQTRALAALRERLDARSGGDRRAWMEAFSPLSVPRGMTPAVPAIGGVLVKKLVVAVVALVVAFVGWRGVGAPLLAELRHRWELGRDGGVRAPTFPLESQAAELAPALAPEELSERHALDPAPPSTGALRLTFRRADGTPAGDLPLALECALDPAPRVEAFHALTDVDGTAEIAGLYAGAVRIWFDVQRFEAEVEAGTTRAFEFTLAALDTIAGTVVDADGAPVAGAQIWCGPSEARWPGGFRVATSGADGAFRVRDVDSWSAIGARKRGFLPSQCWRAGDLHARPDGTYQARLVLGAHTQGEHGSVHGRVLDPDGKPLAHAGVLAGPDGGWTSGAEPGVAPEPAFAETDERGEFELASDLPPGTHPVHASARGFPVWRGMVEVVAGRSAALEIRLERPARIEGRLLGLDGAPAGGVRVIASEEDRGGWYHDRFAASESETDAEGWFVLDWVAPGLRELGASDTARPEIGRARASVACVAGETATCELRLELGLTIAGTVVDENGAPLAGWSVSSEAPFMRQWYPRRANTDAQGRFRLVNLGDSAHDLIVRSPDIDEHPRARLDGVPVGSQDVVLVVADAHLAKGIVRGRILAPQGTQAASFTCTLWKEGGDEGHFFEPDAGGAFELEARPGRYQVRVADAGKTILTSPTFAVEPDGVTELGELGAEDPGRVEITLAGFAPQLLANLRLALDREGAETVRLEAEDGIWSSPELIPGHWRVSLNTSDLCLRPSEIDVAAATTTQVEIRVERAVRVPITFDDPANAGVTVEAVDAAGKLLYQRRYYELSETENASERRLSVGLPIGHATIRVRTRAGRSGQVELDVTPALDGGAPIAVELR